MKTRRFLELLSLAVLAISCESIIGDNKEVFEDVQEQKGEVFLPIEENGKHGYIDASGTIVVAPQFDEAYQFHEGLAAVKIGDKWGFIDTIGKYVINPQFDDIDGNFWSGLAAVKNGNRWGYIDTNGVFVINPQFDDAEGFYFDEGLAKVEIGEKYGYINADGKYVINPQFDYASYFYEGLAEVWIGDKWGFINTEGKYVINPQFDYTQGFSDGLACVRIDNRWGYINTDGKYVINPQFDDAKGFYYDEGLAAVKLGNKWGYINTNGQYVINPQFDDADYFHEGLAAVRIGNRWGYIDKAGKYVINPQFEYAHTINEGIANVKFDGNWGYIDKEGNWVWRPESNQNDINVQQESTNQKPTSPTTNDKNVQGEQWTVYSFPYVCSISIPHTLELRDDELANVFSEVSPYLMKMIGFSGDELFAKQSNIVFQPQGMNSSDPQEIAKATATYARIIIEFGYNDVGQEDVISMTSEDFKEYDEIVGGQYKADFDYAQQSLGQTGSFVWHPTKRERIAGKYCLITDYDRSGLHGMVKVKKYIFYFDGKEIDVTCSYRISEKQKYEKDFEKVIRSIKFD